MGIASPIGQLHFSPERVKIHVYSSIFWHLAGKKGRVYYPKRKRENKGVLYIALAVCQTASYCDLHCARNCRPPSTPHVSSGFHWQFWSMSVCALVNEVNLSTLIIYLFQSGSSCNRCEAFYISGENALEGAVAMAALNEVCVCVCVCVLGGPFRIWDLELREIYPPSVNSLNDNNANPRA